MEKILKNLRIALATIVYLSLSSCGVASEIASIVEHPKCVAETDNINTDIGDVTFLSDKTWKVGKQEWSDVVMASKCQKETFYGWSGDREQFNADCRSNPGFGDLFSWCAVMRFQKQLCPEPWRVPTVEDFIELNRILENNSNRFLNEWGATLGGNCYGQGELDDQNVFAQYWSLSEETVSNSGMILGHFGKGLIVNPRVSARSTNADMEEGFMLRCVK